MFVLHIQTSSRLTSSELSDLCASSHLGSLYLTFSDRRIFKSTGHCVSDLRIVVSSTSSNQLAVRSSYFVFSHLQPHLCIFISHLLQSSLSLHIFGSSSRSYLILVMISVNRFYNLLYIGLQYFMSTNVFPSLSGQPSSSWHTRVLLPNHCRLSWGDAQSLAHDTYHVLCQLDA